MRSSTDNFFVVWYKSLHLSLKDASNSSTFRNLLPGVSLQGSTTCKKSRQSLITIPTQYLPCPQTMVNGFFLQYLSVCPPTFTNPKQVRRAMYSSISLLEVLAQNPCWHHKQAEKSNSAHAIAQDGSFKVNSRWPVWGEGKEYLDVIIWIIEIEVGFLFLSLSFNFTSGTTNGTDTFLSLNSLVPRCTLSSVSFLIHYGGGIRCLWSRENLHECRGHLCNHPGSTIFRSTSKLIK